MIVMVQIQKQHNVLGLMMQNVIQSVESLHVLIWITTQKNVIIQVDVLMKTMLAEQELVLISNQNNHVQELE